MEHKKYPVLRLRPFISFAVLKIYIILFIVVQTSYGQNASKREWAIFQKGVHDYQSGMFAKAEKNFKLVIEKLPDTKLITANYLMLAKARYKQKNYKGAIETVEVFQKKFSSSSYLDDMYFCRANSNYRMGRQSAAVDEWIAVADMTQDQQLKRKALNLLELTVRLKMDKEALTQLQKRKKSALANSVLNYAIAEKYMDEKNIINALQKTADLLNSSQTTQYYKVKARALKHELTNPSKGTIRMAALLPLSGLNADIGRALFDGAKMAVAIHNKTSKPRIDLIPYDYETRLTTAVKKMKEIVSDPTITAVFGPLENDVTAAVAAISEYEDIALITPTASDAELIHLSEGLFQLSMPVDKIGEYLANYASDSLEIKRFITMAPIDDYFNQLTDAFNNKMSQKGIDAISQQWYYPGDKDFANQFKKIKRIGLKLAFQDSLVAEDSLINSEAIDQHFTDHMKRERERLNEEQIKLDSADIPVTTFDGIFLPLFQEDINLIAPQFAYFNIQAQILGNSEWYDLKALKRNKNYLEGLIFTADAYFDETSRDYKQFRNQFRDQYSRTPEKYDLIGFDSFNFILHAIEGKRGVANKTQFKELLKDVVHYTGIYKNFSVGTKRYNASSHLLKYMYGQLVKIE